MIPHAPGAVEELGPAGGGKAFYMKMLREQVAFKRREAARNKEEKAAQSEIGGRPHHALLQTGHGQAP